MNKDDLAEFEALLSQADDVVAMEDVFGGAVAPGIIGLRHDVDDNPGSFLAAQQMARWEQERGFRSTYYILHGASYWLDPVELEEGLAVLAECGHEIAIHVNAIAESITTGLPPDAILMWALHKLRSLGHSVSGAVAHGDSRCHEYHFVNDEMFTECARPSYGAPDRLVGGPHPRKLEPRPLSDFGLEYEANQISRRTYISDSGHEWNIRPAALNFPECGPLHILQHPDWWTDVFDT